MSEGGVVVAHGIKRYKEETREGQSYHLLPREHLQFNGILVKT